MQNITEILWQKITDNHQRVEDFFARKFHQNPPLFYNSVDIRHAGFKIAPIDTNCFPAGFNNLSDTSKELAKDVTDKFLTKNFPNAKKIIIIPEGHTRNLPYLTNVAYLEEIIGAKREVKVGTLNENITESTKIDLENGLFITLHPLKKLEANLLTIDGFEADIAILNNDLTDGIPNLLQNLETPIIPSKNIGWHNRAKSDHFDIYNELAIEMASILEIDPWLISSLHDSCDDIGFKEKKGIDCLSKHVDQINEKLTEKYKAYLINDAPYCYIKADSGTYGIAVWPVTSGTEVLDINKKARNKMNMLKGSVQNNQVLVQEGIKTIDKIKNTIAEPMIYMIGGQVIGNLFRTNDSRDEKISLNAAGAVFHDLEQLSNEDINLGSEKEKITIVYALIARLAALAAAIENIANKNN